MQYTDALVLSVKNKEMTEAEALRRFAEYQTTFFANARRDAAIVAAGLLLQAALPPALKSEKPSPAIGRRRALRRSHLNVANNLFASSCDNLRPTIAFGSSTILSIRAYPVLER